MDFFSHSKSILQQSFKWIMSASLVFGFLTPITTLMAEPREVEMHRLYNRSTGEHFYTSNLEERDTLAAGGWKYEGVGWIAPEAGDPVYRVYNPNSQDHHYTLSENEKDTLVRLGWRDEGIGWYSDPAKHIAVYREYNPNAKTGNHNYTTSLGEHQALVKMGWHDEDIAWYALKEGMALPDTTNELSPLHVQGTQLMNAQNQPVVLQGYSTFGLNYMPEFVDQSVFEFLRDQMGSKIIRLALYTQEYGGYCSGGNKEQFKALIDKGVTLAEQTNQYLIIDWHILSDGNPNTHADEAEVFFREMATKYANKSQVIYEICNEPNGCSWSEIKRYANRIIPVIRAADPQAVILVGTPTWSQDVDIASQDPLVGYTNIMYTCHFYAATHQDNIRQKVRVAHQKGLPIFVSEFGISSADGNGTLNPSSGNAWIELLNQYGISRVGWALSNKNETSALFLPNARIPLSLSDLSGSGQWFHSTYTNTTIPAPDQNVITLNTPIASNTPPSSPIQTTTGDKLKVQLKQEDSWSQGNSPVVKYSLSLENPTNLPIENWQVTLDFQVPVKVSNSWGTMIQGEGETLILTPADYNKIIGTNQSVDNIGLILEWPSNTNPSMPSVQVR